MTDRTVTLRYGDREHKVSISGDGRVRVDDWERPVAAIGAGEFRIEGAPATLVWAVATGSTRWVFLDGRSYEFEVPRERAGRSRSRSHQSSLTAPMPATVRSVNVSAGARVERGDTLIILEAMKMELPVKSGSAGTVRAVHCREGDLVQPGAELIEIDETADAGNQ